MSTTYQKIGALQSLVREYQGLGLFSHCFVESGLFREDTARVCFSTLPEGRDLFDLSSLTKALVTTPLMFQEIGPELKCDQTLQEFAGPPILNENSPLLSLRISALLSHRSGLPAWRNFWLVPREDGTWEFPSQQLSSEEADAQIVRVLSRSGLPLGAGTFSYSDLGFLLLGAALREKTGAGLDRSFNSFCGRTFSDPKTFLGFRPHELLRNTNSIPTAFCALRGRELRGEVHDENCYVLGGVTGHAGLFGTGPGVASFLRQFVRSDLGASVIAENARARNDRVGDDGLLGWRQGKGTTASPFGGGHSIGHYGFTGAGFWIVPNAQGEAASYCLVLSNRIKSGRINPAINAFRKAAHQICWEIVSQ